MRKSKASAIPVYPVSYTLRPVRVNRPRRSGRARRSPARTRARRRYPRSASRRSRDNAAGRRRRYRAGHRKRSPATASPNRFPRKYKRRKNTARGRSRRSAVFGSLLPFGDDITGETAGQRPADVRRASSRRTAVRDDGNIPGFSRRLSPPSGILSASSSISYRRSIRRSGTVAAFEPLHRRR